MSVLVALITFMAFWPALSNDFVDWDDTDNFIRNEAFRGLGPTNLAWMFSTFHMGHYQPLAWLTLGWDSVWGQWVFGPHPVHGAGMHARAYHITNNALHAINAGLVYVLALRLMSWPGFRREDLPGWLVHMAAGVAALLFALHPLRVENVAWITERRDLVSALLLLLTMLAWLKAVEPGQPRAGRWMIASVAIYTLSLLTKVAGVPLVAVMLVLDWYPLQRAGTLHNPCAGGAMTWKRMLIEKAPFAALALAFSAIATVGQSANNWIFPLERHPLAARIVQCFYGLTFYVWKSVVPVDLLPLYELPLPMPLWEWRFIGAMAAVAIAAVLLALFRGRAPALVAAVLCYAALLGPVLGLFQNGPQIVADRYSYLPAIGLSIIAGATALGAWRRFPAWAFRAYVAVLAGVLAALAALTWRQTQVWRSTESLWTYNCEKSPGSSFSQNGRGYVLFAAGDMDAAIPHFEQAIRILPDNFKAHINLWLALEKQGDDSRLLAAIQRASNFPDGQFQAAARAGNRLLNSGRPDDSIPFFEVARQLRPDDAGLRTNFGLALARAGQRDRATLEYQAAIDLDPDLFSARYNSGLNHRAMDRLHEARVDLEAAVRLNPNHQGARDALRSVADETSR